MKWIEATIFTTEQGLDAVCGRLAMLGIDQVEIVQGREEREAFLRDTAKYWDFADMDALSQNEPCVRAYIADLEENAALIGRIKSSFEELKRGDALGLFGALRVAFRTVDDEDWANSWKANYKPFAVGERLLVRPSWENEYEAGGRLVISLDPGMAFGSGTHQTTRMCLEAIERHITPGCAALDLGCGSGILAIAALLLGAKHAVCVDIDPVAEKVAAENARMNGIDPSRYEILIGDALSDMALRERIAQNKYSFISANIVASVVIALAPMVRDLLAEDGVFIASGIIGERLDEVKNAFIENGLAIIEINADEDWRQLAARRAK